MSRLLQKQTVLVLMLLAFAFPALAQGPATGVVYDPEGSPLPGVSVVVKGTTQGAMTDIDGKYSLPNVSNGTTLVFSFIGYATVEQAYQGQPMDITLQESVQEIDEVMVVAFGTAKKSSFTGSASTVKSEEIIRRQVPNITNAISGTVAGVQVTRSNGQPGTTSTIRIRGVGSMSASSAPLYVVDGMPYDGDISSINTSDIETFTVLKDAASNALYGARGANGVILITTKRGERSKDARITVDARWGTNRRGVPNYDVISDPATYYEKVYEAMVNGYSGVKNKDGSPTYATLEALNAQANANIFSNKDGGVGYKVYTLPEGQGLIGLDGKLNPNATLGYSDGTYTYLPDDWYAEAFDKGNIRQEYNVGISGSTDKITYYGSFGYLDDSGIIENSGFTRYSARLNADYQAKKWLKFGTNISYTNYDMAAPNDQTSSGSSANLFYLTNRIAPIYPLYVRDAAGNIMVDKYGFTIYDFGDGKSANQQRAFMSNSNPLSMVALDKVNNVADVFAGRWNMDINIVDGLKFTYRVGVDLDNTQYANLYNAFYGQYSNNGGIVYRYAMRTFSINQQQLLNYHKVFKGVHDFEAMIGHETYDYKYRELGGSKENLYNPYIIEINNAINSPRAYSSATAYATEGWLARVQYDYAQKYIVSASYRRDASSRFHPDNRWGNFGSVGAAWVISKENFMGNASWVDFLKLKASYGIQGNDGLGNDYPYLDQYTLKENNGDFSLSMSYKGNKDLTWETSYAFNTGVDFDFFRGKLGGTVEYFNRRTVDLLYNKPVPMSNGYSSIPTNVGSLSNYGVEVELRSNLFNHQNFRWDIYANGTFWRDKILKLADDLGDEFIQGTTINRVGETRYQYNFYKYAGVDPEDGIAMYYLDSKDDDGNVIGTTTTKVIDQATRYATGCLLPKLYGGFGTTLQFYGFDVSISAAYQLGGKCVDGGYQAIMHSGRSAVAGSAWHKDILNSWTADNPNTDVPIVSTASAASYGNSTSDRFLISSNYLDITNVAVGYTLPKNWMNAMHMESIRLYFSVDNVLLLSARKGLDPRTGFTSTNNYSYSPIRSISGGLTVKF